MDTIRSLVAAWEPVGKVVYSTIIVDTPLQRPKDRDVIAHAWCEDYVYTIFWRDDEVMYGAACTRAPRNP